MTSPAAPKLRTSSRSLTGYLFASPWLLAFFGLMLFPMVVSLWLSTTNWDGLSAQHIQSVGLGNYDRALYEDDNFQIALNNTIYYSLISVPLGLAVSLLLAILLNQQLPGMSVFRTLFYMPHILGGIATMMMWIWVFNPTFGLLNNFLHSVAAPFIHIGLIPATWQPPDWFANPAWSKPALIIMSVWGAGAAMLIFLAALQNVPEQLYEAARIDGAGKLRQFWHVTLPQISPAIFFNLVIGIIGSFQVFEAAFVMTQGGPKQSTLFYVLYLYQKAFQDYSLGYASALAWILFPIILTLTLIVMVTSRLWVYYEGDQR